MARKFCAVDAEGDAGTRGLLGVAIYSDEVQEWLTDHDAIRRSLVRHAERKYTFVAHNMEYDLSVIWWQLDLPAVAVSYNRSFNHGEWKYDRRRPAAQLWDSQNLAGGLGLEELGRAISLPKLPTPQRLRGLDPNQYKWMCERHSEWECVPCYALRDAEIIYRYVCALGDTVGAWGVPIQRRLGATATAVWRGLDQPAPIKLRDGRARYCARQSLVGGRVECLKLGRMGPIWHGDVTSMYPSVMAVTAMPDPAHMVYLDSPSLRSLRLELEGCGWFEVRVPHSYSPPLPNMVRGERVYASGTQRGYWTFLELRHALRLGAELVAAHRVAYSTGVLYPFTSTIATLWELREAYIAAGDPRAQVAKALMNELYGRFGLQTELHEERIERLPDGYHLADQVGKRLHCEYGALMAETTRRVWYERTWVNELWAAQITAAARVKLHQLMLLQGANIVYCDTDSILSLAPLVGTGEGLGELSGEVCYSQAWIVGPKLYRVEYADGTSTSVAKGVSREQAEAFLAGREVYLDRPITPRQMMRGQGAAGSWHTIPRTRQLVPYRRQPVDPYILERGEGWSDTAAPVMELTTDRWGLLSPR